MADSITPHPYHVEPDGTITGLPTFAATSRAVGGGFGRLTFPSITVTLAGNYLVYATQTARIVSGSPSFHHAELWDSVDGAAAVRLIEFATEFEFELVDTPFTMQPLTTILALDGGDHVFSLRQAAGDLDFQVDANDRAQIAVLGPFL